MIGTTVAPSPAESLSGQALKNGWVVGDQVARLPSATGGSFSVCYKVTKDNGSEAFLKALDFSKALSSPDPAKALQELTSLFNFERDLLAACSSLSRIVTAIDEGSVNLQGTQYGIVQYLIFELADGDARAKRDSMAVLDCAWTLRMLHCVATGASQLHTKEIAHQDIKPSNVLIFGQDVAKLGDLGRASAKGVSIKHDAFDFAGDLGYGPPELLYGQTDPDWNRRRLGADVYLLGSMIVYAICGDSTTALVQAGLHSSYRFREWTGTYVDVLPYIRDSFERVMEEVERVRPPEMPKEMIKMARELCEPDPRLRGHPLDRAKNQFSLQRYISRLDFLAKRAGLNS